MTKIDQIAPGQTPQAPAKAGPAAKAEPGSFARLLDKALAPEPETPGPAPAQGPGPAAAPSPAAPAQGLSEAQAKGMESAERVLALLERYAGELGRGKSLKALEPMVGELEDEAANLAELRSGLGQDDELSPRLEEVLSLATSEAFKFRRGDFNPA